jgi:Ca2+-transporting ATPase
VAISTGIMLASIYIPVLAGVFGMIPLSLLDWAAILLSSVILSRIDDFLKDISYLAKLRHKPSFGV